MSPRKKLCARKATWLAFGLIALASAAVSATNEETLSRQNDATTSNIPLPDAPTTSAIATTWNAIPPQDPEDGLGLENNHIIEVPPEAVSQQELDQTAEASRAFKHALSTLSTLTAAQPASHTQGAFPFSHSVSNSNSNSNSFSNSLLSSLLPNVNIQGQGPLGSIIRIVIRLHQQTSLLRDKLFGLGLGGASRKKEDELRGKAIKVVDLLQHSAELGNLDALWTLAQISLFPPTPHFPSSPDLAFESLSTHASMTGNASSQALLAFFYSTGYSSRISPFYDSQIAPSITPDVDQAIAQLYYTFAAHSGSKAAQMALGYRYWSGIGTLEDCGRALDWYRSASEQSMAKFLSGPPGGRTLPHTPTRLSDLVGGVYGPGASVASTGLNTQRPAVKAGMAMAAGETWADVLEYHLFNADRGETDFAYRLGKIFYQGSIYASHGGIASGSEGVGAIPRDYARARYYFLKIARQVWPRDPPNPLHYTPAAIKQDASQVPVGYAAASAAYLGRMYLRGEGVKKDPATAKMWFERGREYGDRECHNGMGIIFRDGLVGGKVDVAKALVEFGKAAEGELAEAEVNLGKYYFNRGEVKLATPLFESAIRHGSPFEAYYYLGEIYASQAANTALPEHFLASSCAMAVSFHKLVAERGVWGDDLLRDAEIDWMSGTDRGKEMAMLKWWMAAERGSEVAQNNLAFVLDQDKSILRLTRFSPMTPSNETARLALTQWTRSAAQRNVDALVKVGDYYYHGLGVSEDSEAGRLEKAAKYYQSAADTQLSALAMWNLGWMYENGVGVPQDFHLAKRHYDLALETNSEAYLPVLLSLGKLYIRSIWHTLLGGKGGLNIWDLDEDETLFANVQTKSTSDGREIDEGVRTDSASEEPTVEEEVHVEKDDGPWYLGKAKEEFHRRRRGQEGSKQERLGEEDPVQWARDRRNAEQERDNDFGPEDYFEGALRGGNRERENDADEFQETMLLVLLCLAVSILLYLRTRLVDRMRRDQQQQGPNANEPQPQAERGVFPPPGDPAQADWAILR